MPHPVGVRCLLSYPPPFWTTKRVNLKSAAVFIPRRHIRSLHMRPQSALGSSRSRVTHTAPRNLASSLTTSVRSEEHTSELQSLMRISYAVFCLKKKKTQTQYKNTHTYN